jgi:hypothetical protein
MQLSSQTTLAAEESIDGAAVSCAEVGKIRLEAAAIGPSHRRDVPSPLYESSDETNYSASGQKVVPSSGLGPARETNRNHTVANRRLSLDLLQAVESRRNSTVSLYIVHTASSRIQGPRCSHSARAHNGPKMEAKPDAFPSSSLRPGREEIRLSMVRRGQHW